MLKLKLFDFKDMSEFCEWLCQHANDIPEAGIVWFIKTHAEQQEWIKVGDGKRKFSDLPPLLPQEVFMSNCSCYHPIIYSKHPPIYRDECWGTKEREECSCGGDERKCNFYPEKRQAAIDNSEPTWYEAPKQVWKCPFQKEYIVEMHPTFKVVEQMKNCIEGECALYRNGNCGLVR